MSRNDERGSGTVLMMTVTLITAFIAFVCACLLAWFGCVHRARAAADLAALAGADAYRYGGDACTVARQTTKANNARMTACAVDSNGVNFVVRVTVSVDAKPRIAFGPTQFSHSSEAGNF